MMTETDSKEQYIKCTRCKCKYINDDEHIKIDFGFTRLGERLKTCNICRTKRLQYNKDYYNQNKDKILEHMVKYNQEHKEEIKQQNKEYRERNIDRLREYDKARGKIKAVCDKCGKEVGKTYLPKHQQTQNCVSQISPNSIT